MSLWMDLRGGVKGLGDKSGFNDLFAKLPGNQRDGRNAAKVVAALGAAYFAAPYLAASAAGAGAAGAGTTGAGGTGALTAAGGTSSVAGANGSTLQFTNFGSDLGASEAAPTLGPVDGGGGMARMMRMPSMGGGQQKPKEISVADIQRRGLLYALERRKRQEALDRAAGMPPV